MRTCSSDGRGRERMEIVRTFTAAREIARGAVGLVPTMGYLHEGHLSLAEAARACADTVVMSVFVNPLQFGDGEDLDTYPRDQARDIHLARDAGVDVLFAPPDEEMFPTPGVTRVSVDGLTDTLEGSHRPGHFQGVATVVAKLFAGLRPDMAFFGRKDAQQLAVITRMVADLSFPIDVIGVPIVREQDGLALSSRNTRLNEADRGAALSLSAGLMAAGDAVDTGERTGAMLESIVRDHLEIEPKVVVEYVAMVACAGVTLLGTLDRNAFLAGAVRVGGVRLIDNIHLDVTPHGSVEVDRGSRLDRPSVLYDARVQ